MKQDVKILVKRLGSRFYVISFPSATVIPASAQEVGHRSLEAAQKAAQIEQEWARH